MSTSLEQTFSIDDVNKLASVFIFANANANAVYAGVYEKAIKDKWNTNYAKSIITMIAKSSIENAKTSKMAAYYSKSANMEKYLIEIKDDDFNFFSKQKDYKSIFEKKVKIAKAFVCTDIDMISSEDINTLTNLWVSVDECAYTEYFDALIAASKTMLCTEQEKLYIALIIEYLSYHKKITESISPEIEKDIREMRKIEISARLASETVYAAVMNIASKDSWNTARAKSVVTLIADIVNKRVERIKKSIIESDKKEFSITDTVSEHKDVNAAKLNTVFEIGLNAYIKGYKAAIDAFSKVSWNTEQARLFSTVFTTLIEQRIED